MNIITRFSKPSDIPGIIKLLKQVNDIHASGRPDLFISGKTKYSENELESIMKDPKKPIFVAINENDNLIGYGFCIILEHSGCSNLHPVKTLYIDDLCIDENSRGKNVGKTVFNAIKAYAVANGFHNLTLNVWQCNPDAMKFYEYIGMKTYKTGMELLLDQQDDTNQ